MHDANLDDRLRSILRGEGDALPFTITTDELERRLVLRRRARFGQRMRLVAAGLAAVAVGTIFTLGSGMLQGTDVATQPSPSPTASSPGPSVSGSAAPSATSPSPAPTPAPTPREANPLGEPTEAILVAPVGDATRPDAFVVTAYEVVSGVSRPIAEVPGAILPETARIDDGNAPPRVSETGFLAIPFILGPTEDEARRAVAIVDLRAPDAPAFVIDNQDAIAWDPADKLVMERDGVITIAWPMSRFLEPFGPLGVGVSVLNVNAIGGGPAITTTEGARFMALSGDGDGNRWGYLDFGGRFVATDDLPAMYQRTGIERPTGAGGHTLGMGCDTGPTSESAGCFLVESDARGEPIRTWLDVDARPLHDHAWAADGRSAWLLVDRSTGDDLTAVELRYATSPDEREIRASVPIVGGRTPRILGIAGEAIPGDALAFVIGDDVGLVQAFLDRDGSVTGFEGTAWFAGWAGQQPAYDPD